MTAKLTALFLVAVFLLGFAAPVQADGIIIPPAPPPCPAPDCPPRAVAQLVIRYHHVAVTIQGQLAVTRVDQVFHNPNQWPVEGTYVFPLPVDAAVSDFTLWVDGKPVSGEVLSAEEARRYYDEVVRSLRDPALLEYIDRGALRASVFPIPPGGEQRIELEYTQALTAENGLVRYAYPLNTEKFSARPLEDVSVQVEISDAQSIRAVYSPSHAIALDRQSENRVTVGYEATDVLPDTDFTLYYSLGESEAFHLLSYRNPADPLDPDGFFLALLAPRPGENPVRVDKDILLVLDHSGSMDGEKFQQAQAALRYILGRLNPRDRFYLQAFSTGIETYASGLRSASEAREALEWVDRLSAAGSTDINRALLEASAVVDAERPTYLIFLTDGLPTEGVVDTPEILRNFAASAPDNLRLFSFGVGYDVDTVLLDTLSQENHGLSTYVGPGEPLDEVLSAFYQRISTPVLTDLSLDFGRLAAFDIYPNPLPDLFAESQVIVVGRYRAGGPTDVALQGQVNGQLQTFRFPEQVFDTDSRGQAENLEMLPRLWATRKIGYLLNRIRLAGPDKETIEQIVQLSIRYGIVTPYTSYLVKEPLPLGMDAQERIVEDAFGAAKAAPLEASGRPAVERAAQEGQMRSADVAPAAPLPDLAGQNQAAAIKIVGARTFVLQEGAWVDTAYDPQQMNAQEIVFLSDLYRQLLDVRPDLVPALALGDQLILVVDGQAYHILPDGQPVGPVELPPALPASNRDAGPSSGEATVAVPAADAVLDQAQEPPAQVRGGYCAALGFIPLFVFGLLLGFGKWRRR